MTYDPNHMVPEPFDRLPKAAISMLTVQQGDTLFRFGDPTRGLFASLDAEVHLIRTAQDGHEILIHRAVAGTCFAEASLFSKTYHCDAVVQSDGTVYRIDKAAVLNAFGNAQFAEAYCNALAHQVQQIRQIREIIAIRSADDRVFAGLVAGLHTGQVIDFAAAISLSHEATYRALRKLVIAGRVKNPARGVYRLANF